MTPILVLLRFDWLRATLMSMCGTVAALAVANAAEPVRLRVDFSRPDGTWNMPALALGQGGLQSDAMIEPHIKELRQLRPRTIRTFLSEYYRIYPDHGRYDWSRLDRELGAVRAAGARPTLALFDHHGRVRPAWYAFRFLGQFEGPRYGVQGERAKIRAIAGERDGYKHVIIWRYEGGGPEQVEVRLDVAGAAGRSSRIVELAPSSPVNNIRVVHFGRSDDLGGVPLKLGPWDARWVEIE
jgi:hypothetical protein